MLLSCCVCEEGHHIISYCEFIRLLELSNEFCSCIGCLDIILSPSPAEVFCCCVDIFLIKDLVCYDIKCLISPGYM